MFHEKLSANFFGGSGQFREGLGSFDLVPAPPSSRPRDLKLLRFRDGHAVGSEGPERHETPHAGF